MKRLLLILLAFAPLFFSCADKESAPQTFQDQSQMLKQAQIIDSVYATTGAINEDITQKFIDSVIEFASENPADETAPELLAKAGGYCMRMANMATDKTKKAEYSKQAISIFDKIINVYPEHPIVKYCYWWKGIIYEDILQMLPSAENEYREFLHRFPDDTLAVSIRYSLEHLGEVSSEVILENE